MASQTSSNQSSFLHLYAHSTQYPAEPPSPVHILSLRTGHTINNTKWPQPYTPSRTASSSSAGSVTDCTLSPTLASSPKPSSRPTGPSSGWCCRPRTAARAWGACTRTRRSWRNARGMSSTRRRTPRRGKSSSWAIPRGARTCCIICTRRIRCHTTRSSRRGCSTWSGLRLTARFSRPRLRSRGRRVYPKDGEKAG